MCKTGHSFLGGHFNDGYSYGIHPKPPAHITNQQIATISQNENCQHEVMAVRYQSDNHSLSSVLIPQASPDRQKLSLITGQVILIVMVAVVISVILSVTIMIVLMRTTNISFPKHPSNSEHFAGNELVLH